MSLDRLKLLESRIGEFLDEHERVRQEHDTLVRRLRDREKELAEAAAQLRRYEQERSEIKGRLERILGRLESVDLTEVET
jgi:septal ring factor EnvC (AmiA/AmiB activator)